ncbi:hypothetical protein [Actinoplanes sp. G11-F43]|uniref:hypothetical protein n=1 Tax=Actinoplanes sp. G11-F43 TaxID=3424130 RepID=UPI003D338A00
MRGDQLLGGPAVAGPGRGDQIHTDFCYGLWPTGVSPVGTAAVRRQITPPPDKARKLDKAESPTPISPMLPHSFGDFSGGLSFVIGHSGKRFSVAFQRRFETLFAGQPTVEEGFPAGRSRPPLLRFGQFVPGLGLTVVGADLAAARRHPHEPGRVVDGILLASPARVPGMVHPPGELDLLWTVPLLTVKPGIPNASSPGRSRRC